MFDRFKKKPETEEPVVAEEPKVTEEPKPEITEKPQAPGKQSKKTKRTKKSRKPAKTAEDNTPKSPQAPIDVTAKKPFIGIKEYSSVSEIAESIDKELAETKSALGEYLRQLDDRRTVAERTQRIHKIVAKIADKKPSEGNSNHVDLNGLEIVVDATVLNELTAIENVVKSHQKRLIALQKTREALQTLDHAGATEGITYLTLEKEGIPEQILLKL